MYNMVTPPTRCDEGNQLVDVATTTAMATAANSSDSEHTSLDDSLDDLQIKSSPGDVIRV